MGLHKAQKSAFFAKKRNYEIQSFTQFIHYSCNINSKEYEPKHKPCKRKQPQL